MDLMLLNDKLIMEQNNKTEDRCVSEQIRFEDLNLLESLLAPLLKSSPWKVQHPFARVDGYEVADKTGLNRICSEIRKEQAEFIACANPIFIQELIKLARQALLTDARTPGIARAQPLTVSDERKDFEVYWEGLDSENATKEELAMCEAAAWQAWQARPRRCLALPVSAYPHGAKYGELTCVPNTKLEPDAVEVVYQVLFCEGGEWQEVWAEDFYVARANGSKTRILKVDTENVSERQEAPLSK